MWSECLRAFLAGVLTVALALTLVAWMAWLGGYPIAGWLPLVFAGAALIAFSAREAIKAEGLERER